MRVLDLYAGHLHPDGTHGFSAAFVHRGHDVITLDLNPSFRCTISADILDPATIALVASYAPYEYVLASPPCEAFSTGAFSHSFRCEAQCAACGGSLLRIHGERWLHLPNSYCQKQKPVPGSLIYTPKSETGNLGLAVAEATVQLIRYLKPRFWTIENPRALLRKLPFMLDLPRVTIDQCQYGNIAKKPTDLWGGFPTTWIPRPRCIASSRREVWQGRRPYRPNPDGTLCHEAGWRGSPFGTQGKANAALRAVIPYELSLALCLAAEQG